MLATFDDWPRLYPYHNAGVGEGGLNDEDETEMMKQLGIPTGFDSTQGKPVPGADVSRVRAITKRQPTQYMNRKGGAIPAASSSNRGFSLALVHICLKPTAPGPFKLSHFSRLLIQDAKCLLARGDSLVLLSCLDSSSKTLMKNLGMSGIL
ncbi:hypothetical protein Peur_008478 [Populus x canadensis]